MLRFLAAGAALFLSLSAAAEMQFNLDESYLYSSIQDQTSSSFSVLSKGGLLSHAEFSIGGPQFDFFLSGQMAQANYEAPTSKTVNGSSLQLADYSAGVRWKASSAWFKLAYNLNDAPYLENIATDTYNLKKASVSFYSLGLHLFGTGRGYKLGVDVDGYLPASTASTLAGTMTYSYEGRGTVHIDFGKTFIIGVQSGIETHQYTVSTDKYFRTDFFAGIALGYTFGAGPGRTSSVGNYGGGR